MNAELESLELDRFPYPSRRMPVLATRGVVATGEPLAAQAGLRILAQGGNAVDAAIATAIALTVTEPVSNGIGGDAFALVWDGKTLHGLNGSGRALAAHTPELFARLGHAHVPTRGWLPVTVPGGPAAWHDLHAKLGRLPFAALFAPAIEYAERGFPVAPLTAARWASSALIYAGAGASPELAAFGKTFLREGAAPRAGEICTLPDHARTLRALAEGGADVFYRGALGQAIVDFAAASGGHITRDDLASHSSTWVEPIGVKYRGHELWEIPPNGTGIAALITLAILEGLDLARHPRESAESYHLQIEAMKLGYTDAERYVSDPAFADVPVRALLEPAYIASRRNLITDKAMLPAAGEPRRSDTVYLCTADQDGMMVSLIQSNFSGWILGFGSGIVVPGTGIALHSRGAAFSLDPRSPNVIAPGKRPAHTIIPAFVTCGSEAVGPMGVMGGPMQPQGHVQMMVNHLDYKMNPQTCLDAPRWQWVQGRNVAVEELVPADVVRGLEARGHIVERRAAWDVASAVPQRTAQGMAAPGDFGKGQIIRRMKNGVYVAGSEPRADGAAVGF